MLGQGKESGGTKQHATARMDLMDRVESKFPLLWPKHQVNYEEFKRRYDHINSRIVGHKGASFGSHFLNEMKRLVERFRSGHLKAFDEWMAQQISGAKAILGDYVAI